MSSAEEAIDPGAPFVCPVALAGGLSSPLRRLLHNPRRMLGRYVREGMTVLDVGCGPGFFSLEMARMVGEGGRVIAADLQQGMLDRLEGRMAGTGLEGRITLHRCSPDRIGVRGPVDLVLAFFMVHEVPDRARFLREVASLLRPGGLFLLVEPLVHVPRRGFESTVGMALEVGFELVRRFRVFIGRAAVLMAALEGEGEERVEG